MEWQFLREVTAADSDPNGSPPTERITIGPEYPGREIQGVKVIGVWVDGNGDRVDDAGTFSLTVIDVATVEVGGVEYTRGYAGETQASITEDDVFVFHGLNWPGTFTFAVPAYAPAAASALRLYRQVF